jgi:hypothetical protein
VVEGPAADCATSASLTAATRAPGGAAVRRVFSSGRELRRLVGPRVLAAAALLLLIVIGSVIAWQLGGSPSGPFRASVPSVIGQRSQTSVASDARQRFEWPAGHLPRLQEKTTARSRPHAPRARTVRHTGAPKPAPEASPSPSSPVEATYHSSQPTSSAPAASSYQPPAAPTSSTAESTTSHGTSAASVASVNTTHSSPAAFGATGALGPMSSSDG